MLPNIGDMVDVFTVIDVDVTRRAFIAIYAGLPVTFSESEYDKYLSTTGTVIAHTGTPPTTPSPKLPHVCPRPTCSSPAFIMFSTVECSNQHCQNWKSVK